MNRKTFYTFSMFLLMMLILLSLFLLAKRNEESFYVAKEGRVVISKETDESFVIPLRGEWRFYPNQIIRSHAQINDKSYANYLKVPRDWNSEAYGRTYPVEYYGTYYLKLRFSENLVGEKLYILIPSIYSKSEAYIDDQVLYFNGDLAIESNNVDMGQNVYSFLVNDSFMELFIPVYNSVAEKGGITENVFIGTKNQVYFYQFVLYRVSFLFAGGILLMLIYFLIQLIIRKQRRIAFAGLGFLLFTMMIKLLVHYQMPILSIWPNIVYETLFRFNTSLNIVIVFELVFLYCIIFNKLNKKVCLGIVSMVTISLLIPVWMVSTKLLYSSNKYFEIIFVLCIGFFVYVSGKLYLKENKNGFLFYLSANAMFLAAVFDIFGKRIFYTSIYLEPYVIFGFVLIILYHELSYYQEYYNENKDLSIKTKSLSDDIIYALVSSIDARDEYTQGHSQRVKEYSVGIGKEMRLDSRTLEKLEYSALLHDVGKIGIEDAILRKPEGLSQSEYEKIKRHPIIGMKILSQVESLKGFLDGVHYHHERIDGSGYPARLRGDEIPLIARIIAVADAYDAMSSNRNYAKQRSRNQILEEIKENAGTQFDEEIVTAFVKYISRRNLNQNL